jgi:hypothetical protein
VVKNVDKFMDWRKLEVPHLPSVEGDLAPSIRAAFAFSGQASCQLPLQIRPFARTVDMEGGDKESYETNSLLALLKDGQIVVVAQPDVSPDPASPLFVVPNLDFGFR